MRETTHNARSQPDCYRIFLTGSRDREQISNFHFPKLYRLVPSFGARSPVCIFPENFKLQILQLIRLENAILAILKLINRNVSKCKLK